MYQSADAEVFLAVSEFNQIFNFSHQKQSAKFGTQVYVQLLHKVQFFQNIYVR